MVIRAFITHKQAEKFADCQDRFGVAPDTKSIAVSDGMGATWQQKIWAQLLVDTFIESRDWQPTKNTTNPLCYLWRNKVERLIEQLKKKPRTSLSQREINELDALIYRNERNLIAGRSAGATFVGIRFSGNIWNGSVLGDSCLIEWDGNEAKFNTSQDTDAFDSYPDYFDSNPLKDGKGTPKSIEGTLKDGTILFLVSDPFSEFMLEHSKQGDIAKYVQQLLSLASHDDFEALVDEWREEGMHNDDTTLVIIESDNAEALTITYADNIAEMIEKEKSFEDSLNQVKEVAQTSPMDTSQNDIEVAENFVVVQNDEKAFADEFLTEYQRCLQKKFPKQMGKLKYKWTQKAVEEAFNILLEKYSIIKK